jgi:hypothetical protein
MGWLASGSRLFSLQARLREQRMDVAVQGLDLLNKDLVAGLLAEEQQQLAAGIDDQAALLGFAFPGCLSIGFGLAPKWSS